MKPCDEREKLAEQGGAGPGVFFQVDDGSGTPGIQSAGMDADRTFYTWRGRMRSALRQWQASDRDEGALLRGAPLAEAEGWLVVQGTELSPAGREFIQASRARRDEKRRAEEARRQRELDRTHALAEAERQRAKTQTVARQTPALAGG